MYQINCTDGIQLVVIGKGNNGLCRIVDRNGHVRLEAAYDACAKWLADRGIKQLG